MIEQTVLDLLFGYGVLGLWTATLLYEKLRYQRKMEKVIKNNTEAMIRVTESITKCRKR